jgi:hypothetical protein
VRRRSVCNALLPRRTLPLPGLFWVAAAVSLIGPPPQGGGTAGGLIKSIGLYYFVYSPLFGLTATGSLIPVAGGQRSAPGPPHEEANRRTPKTTLPNKTKNEAGERAGAVVWSSPPTGGLWNTTALK